MNRRRVGARRGSPNVYYGLMNRQIGTQEESVRALAENRQREAAIRLIKQEEEYRKQMMGFYKQRGRGRGRGGGGMGGRGRGGRGRGHAFTKKRFKAEHPYISSIETAMEYLNEHPKVQGQLIQGMQTQKEETERRRRSKKRIRGIVRDARKQAQRRVGRGSKKT